MRYRFGRHGQVHAFVAASSQREVARLTNSPIGEVRDYWSQAGGRHEEFLLANPGVVFLEVDGELVRDELQEKMIASFDAHIEHLAEARVRKAGREEQAPARRERTAENLRSSNDWVARLATVGIEAKVGWSGDLVVEVNPEILYGQVAETIGLFRDVGIEDHPFAGEGVLT